MSTTQVSKSRQELALECVTRYAWGNAACGLIPVPGLDLLALAGVQVKMVGALAKIYDTPAPQSRTRTVVMALLGSLGSATVATGVICSVVKFIPFLGVQASVVALPAVAGAVTYAIGKVFIMHFEAGGTVLDFDPKAMKKYFQEYYQQGLDRSKSEEKK